MPEIKVKDGHLLYPFHAIDGIEEWQTTHEGKKLMTFITHKGNSRFYYGYAKIRRIKNRLLTINVMFGWNWYNGIKETKCRLGFKRMDEKAKFDYETYLKSKMI
jgi:hypothetical protein